MVEVRVCDKHHIRVFGFSNSIRIYVYFFVSSVTNTILDQLLGAKKTDWMAKMDTMRNAVAAARSGSNPSSSSGPSSPFGTSSYSQNSSTSKDVLSAVNPVLKTEIDDYNKSYGFFAAGHADPNDIRSIRHVDSKYDGTSGIDISAGSRPNFNNSIVPETFGDWLSERSYPDAPVVSKRPVSIIIDRISAGGYVPDYNGNGVAGDDEDVADQKKITSFDPNPSSHMGSYDNIKKAFGFDVPGDATVKYTEIKYDGTSGIDISAGSRPDFSYYTYIPTSAGGMIQVGHYQDLPVKYTRPVYLEIIRPGPDGYTPDYNNNGIVGTQELEGLNKRTFNLDKEDMNVFLYTPGKAGNVIYRSFNDKKEIVG